MSTSTTTEPRFQRRSARGRPEELASPLPPTLAELPELQELAARHAALSERAGQAREAFAAATSELAAAQEGDRKRGVDAALAGRTAPSTRRSVQAHAKVTAAREELELVTEAVARSADELLHAALPLVPRAAESARESEAAAIERALDLFAAADAELARAQVLHGEGAWLAARREDELHVPVYRQSGADPDVGQVRGRIREELAGLLHRRERAASQRERLRRWEEENRPEWERREREAVARAERSRVVMDGWKVERPGDLVAERVESS